MREEKNRVRQVMRCNREVMTPAERRERSERICSHVLALIPDRETVMVYSAKELEANTLPLIRTLLARGNRVIVPIIVKADVSLRLSYLEDPAVLVPSTFNVPEPIGNEIPARPGDVDTIILPMLGFDRNGGRLGYGDSAIFSPIGAPLAEAGLFTERLVTADVGPYLKESRWRKRDQLRTAIVDQWAEAARAALRKK